MRWERYVKKMVPQLFIKERTTRLRDRQTLENYYDAIYKVLQDANQPDTTFIALKTLRVKSYDYIIHPTNGYS
jgi:hypothetical protein